MYCSKCGFAISNNLSSCEKCGEQIGGVKNVISYDYLTVQADNKAVYEVIDNYRALGWEVVNKSHPLLSGSVSIDFKRNRKIKNKEQLNRLQVKLDDCFNGIRFLEKSKTQTAMVVALILGIIGTLIFGTGMSLCIAWESPELWMYISGGIIAAAGAVPCCLAYFVYNKIRTKKTAAMNLKIEQKRDEITSLCEDAQKFLS